MFASWGRVAHRHRTPVLLAVLIAVITGGIWGLGVFDRMSQGGYEAPGSEAAQAENIAADSGAAQNGDLVVVYTAPEGKTIDDPALAAEINDALGALPDEAITDVTSYWQTPVPQLANEERTSGLASVELDGAGMSEKMAAYERVQDSFDVEGAQAEVAGEVPPQQSMEERSMSDLAMAEAVSLPIVLILLVVIFGGLVAAAMPVFVGGLAVLGSLGLLHVISLFAGVNVFAINVASLLGLGMAIDYGLFMVGRFREELADGRATGEAVSRTMASAGRIVAFSVTLLVIALAGLMLFPQEFLKSLAYVGMSAVALAAVISLTLLPAMLGLLGHRVDKLAVPWRKNHRAGGSDENGGWARFADAVMKRPVLTAVPIIGVLIALGAPFLDMQFGTPDERMLPEGDSARRAIETLSEEFPNTSADGVQLVVQGAPERPALQEYLGEVGRLQGVRDVQPGGRGGDVTVFNASLTGDPFGDASNQTVEDIRALEAPTGGDVLVGGPTALNLDSLNATADIMPWVAGLIVGATLLLMFLAFGSVLLPIKAVVMSALSLSATFGVLAWIFVEGHGAELLGVTPTPMEVGIVVVMASVVFGLSTDYEVFLLSRMVEARANGATTEEAVRAGITRTGRVITAAALLLLVVTGAFAFSGITMMRLIGVGMIVALALDATVVRMLLVPAVIKLMGSASWWSPGPLKRMQQRAGVQEEDPDPTPRELQHTS